MRICGTLASAGRRPGTVRAVSGLAEVQEAFRSLPERYLGAHPGFDAT